MRHARHVRRSTRTPSRIEILAKNMKRRAQKEEVVTEDPKPPEAPADAPYDPVTVPVRELSDRLAEIDDAASVRALQEADPRTSADRHYDARLEELDG